MAIYDKGDRVRVTALFKTAGTGVATTATATQKKPSGADTALTVIGGSGTGIYYVDVDLDQVGVHTVKIDSTDVVIASETIGLEVGKSVFDHS